jgi:hypothetical protein
MTMLICSPLPWIDGTYYSAQRIDQAQGHFHEALEEGVWDQELWTLRPRHVVYPLQITPPGTRYRKTAGNRLLADWQYQQTRSSRRRGAGEKAMRNAQNRGEHSTVPDFLQALLQPRKPQQRIALPEIRHAHSRGLISRPAMFPTLPDRIPTAPRPSGCGVQMGRTHELARRGFPQTPGNGLPTPPREEARWRHHTATERSASSASWQTPVPTLTRVGMVVYAATLGTGRSTSRHFPDRIPTISRPFPTESRLNPGCPAWSSLRRITVIPDRIPVRSRLHMLQLTAYPGEHIRFRLVIWASVPATRQEGQA